MTIRKNFLLDEEIAEHLEKMARQIDANDDARVTYKKSLSILVYLAEKQIKMYTSCDLITAIFNFFSSINNFYL